MPLFGEEAETHIMDFPTGGPWFTGPLRAPGAGVVPSGHIAIGQTISLTTYTGIYDSRGKVSSVPNFYEVVAEATITIGIVKGVDIGITPQIVFNETSGERYFNAGDLPIQLDFQLYQTELGEIWPNIRLSLGVVVPVGKYEHLKEKYKGVDAIGDGSWFPSFCISTSKLWNTSDEHFLEIRLAGSCQIGTPVYVEGFNSYGGSNITKGFVYPGNEFSLDSSFEYNFTQNWVLSCDLSYLHVNKTRFSGRNGVVLDGIPINKTPLSGRNRVFLRGLSPEMTQPASEELSIAPAIEYNWTDNIGMIAGVWFPVLGRNTDRFISAIFSLNIYI